MIHVDFYRILMPTCQHLQCVKTEPIWCRGSHCNFAGCFLFRVYCVQRKLEKGQRLLPIISWWKWEMPSWDGLPMQNKVRKNMFKVLLKKMEVCPMITLEMLRTAHTSRLVRLFLHAAHFLNFCIAFTPNLLSLTFLSSILILLSSRHQSLSALHFLTTCSGVWGEVHWKRLWDLRAWINVQCFKYC